METKQAKRCTSLLRISGAVQVLEEMLGEPQPGHTHGLPSPEPHDRAVTP